MQVWRRPSREKNAIHIRGDDGLRCMGSSTTDCDTVVGALQSSTFRYCLGYSDSRRLYADADLHDDLIAVA